MFLFVAIWGLGHFGPSVDQTLGLDVREYSKQELIAATAYYAAQANEYAEKVERDAENLTVYPAFSELAKQAPGGYAALAQQYDPFTDGLGPVKPLASWRLFSQTGTTGIFICFTAEAWRQPGYVYRVDPLYHVPRACPPAGRHSRGRRELLRLSGLAWPRKTTIFATPGAFGAYIYCHNALSKIDKTAASQIWSTLSDGVLADIRAANAHYEQYEGKVQDAAQKVNDTYLKAFSEESGVQSYGEAADLLIAWYLKNNA